MADRRLEGLVRLIDKRKAGDKSSAETMIDLGEVSDVSGSAGAVPTCTVDGDDADVFEPYGLAGQAASGDALVFAPGGDSDSLTALVSSVAGRPATEPGDKALWTAGGHVVYLDDDRGLTITSKDGATVELSDTGGIVITAASLANITLIVDNGQAVNVGDALAAALLKAEATETYLIAAANAVTGTPDVELGFAAFAAALAGLANAAATTKAKGT